MKHVSAAADRNKTFICDLLNPYIPPAGRVLEIASGTGQHAAYICEQRPDIIWQPTDTDPLALASIEAYRLDVGLNSFREPVSFDIREDIPVAISPPYDVIVNINMIHISPWQASLSLLNRSMRLLKPKGILYLYGPYFEEGVDAAPSNLEFDRSLKERDPEWGIRRLEKVVEEAEKRDLHLVRVVQMPANNLSVILQKGTA